MPETPSAGGSYRRNPDGSLTRIEEPTAPAVPAVPAAPAEVTEPAAPKAPKGKE